MTMTMTMTMTKEEKMTKTEAILKVRKLRKLAEKNESPGEASSAIATAKDLCRKHNLTEADLTVGTKAEAFDDLIERLDAYTKTRRELPDSIAYVLERMKRDMKEEEKSSALEQVVAAARIGSIFLGKKMGPVKEIVEETLRRHSLVI
jgi:hypothetical protein